MCTWLSMPPGSTSCRWRRRSRGRSPRSAPKARSCRRRNTDIAAKGVGCGRDRAAADDGVEAKGYSLVRFRGLDRRSLRSIPSTPITTPSTSRTRSAEGSVLAGVPSPGWVIVGMIPIRAIDMRPDLRLFPVDPEPVEDVCLVPANRGANVSGRDVAIGCGHCAVRYERSHEIPSSTRIKRRPRTLIDWRSPSLIAS